MRRGGSVTAAAGTSKLLRQRQAGRCLVPSCACPPHGAEDMESAGAFFSGQAAPARCSGFQHPLMTAEQFRKAKQHVERAIKEKKIFMLLGSYPIIRSQLRAWGWVERKVTYAGRPSNWLEQHHGHQKKQLEEEEEAWPSLGTEEPLHFPCPPEEEKECWDEYPDSIHEAMSRMVQKQVPNLIWAGQLSAVNSQLLQQNQLVNRYAQVGALTTKEGLCRNIRNLPWFEQADPDTFFPRCYLLRPADDRQAFIEDFRLTAARSLLKMALKRMEQPPKASEKPGALKPALASQLVEKALQVCEQHLGSLQHQDIDGDPASPGMTDAEWYRFLQDYYHVVHRGARLVLSEAQQKRCQDLLQLLAQWLPQLSIEGDHNIWILKPGAKSRGRGIVCTGQLKKVLHLLRGSLSGEWVVQKYVERPLLIFGIKFDIRQWFLVTNWNPLTVWFYRDCYLRFCSQHFSLRKLDSARHLCNVSIQKWYKLAPDWPPQLPLDQIWSSQQFQEYLAQTGRPDVWDQVTVPGMKAAVLGALRSSRDMMQSRKGSFELYGADFILGEDCQPWLLEINSSPTMAPSAEVTTRLCANVQRDTLRVMLNHKDSPGAFELIYKEAVIPTTVTPGLKLVVEGHALKSQLPQDQYQTKASTINLCLPEPPPAVVGARGCCSSITDSGSPRLLCPGSPSPMPVPWPGDPSHHPGKALASPRDPQVLSPSPVLPSCRIHLAVHPVPGPHVPPPGSRPPV
ncbi:tubulin monoglycylase TTLL3-like [Porphyrio hochstetteri]